MSTGYVILVLGAYFTLLFLVARLSTRKADSATFFIANRRAPWVLVSYGMIGVAISGITYISVPGQVVKTQFSYMQLVLGIVIGLLIVGFVLLPVFYRIKAISIYSYLHQRFGTQTHKTASIFFLLAQMATASFKLFLMANVLQIALFDQLEMPFWLTVAVTLSLIWFYTYRGGIKTVILTDSLQTTFLLLALVLSIWAIARQLDQGIVEMYASMNRYGISRMFFWSWEDPNNFFKLLFTGILLTVMTNGLDQSVMQKHLTCENLRASQKNISTLALVLIAVNFLFLFLGGALHLFVLEEGLDMPALTDNLFPFIAIDQLGMMAGTFFLVGIAAAAYSSADSSLTGLTTSFCLDLLKFDLNDESRIRYRELVHLGFTVAIFVVIMVFNEFNNDSVLYYFIRTSGFIYGPLLSLFLFGIYSKRSLNDRFIPYVCIASPLLCVLIDQNSEAWLDGYNFGYDILLLNSMIAYLLLYILSSGKNYLHS